MIETQHISTSSTISEYNNRNNNLNSEEDVEKEETPNWQKCSSKRFKNLVECYLCKVEDCQILFETKEDLDLHKKTHIKLYKCNFINCEKTFIKIINLRKHTKEHYKNRKKYTCPFEGCGKSFTASYSLSLHYRIHTGITPYKCEICEKRFFDRANYQYHINNMHKKIIAKKLTCQHKNCGHKSKSIKQLLMHHDKLEEQCIKEKNLLLKLLMYFQNATIPLLNINKNEIQEFEKMGKEIGVDDEKKNLWSLAINKCELDGELKNDLNLIEIQSKIVINSSIDKIRYQGIIDNMKK